MLRVLEFFLVREHERSLLKYFLLLFLALGCGTAIGRGTADALFFKRYGIEYLPLMYLLLGLVLMVVSTAYAAFADRLPAERFFRILCGSLAVLLVGNWLLITFTGWDQVYPLYFQVYEVASELLLVHSGFYVSQNFDSQQTKRLLPLILAGTQLGSIAGGLLLSALAPRIGVQNMLLVWAMLCLLATGMMRRHHVRAGTSAYFRSGKRSARKLRQAWEEIVQGVRFTGRSSLLQAISLALFCTVIAFYILCYVVNRIYTETFTSEAELAGFFGMLTALTGGGALLIQLFITNRVIDRFGIKAMNLIFPATVIGSFAGLIGSFSLPFALLASVVKDVINPAVRSPVNSLFFQALPGYMEGRARAMSVAIVMPCALAVTGSLLWLVQHLANTVYFLALGMTAAVGFMYSAWRMNRAYIGSILQSLRAKVFVPGDVAPAAHWGGHAAREQLMQALQTVDEDSVRIAADSLVAAFGAQATLPIVNRLATVSEKTADYLVRLITPYVDDQCAVLLRRLLPQAAPRLQGTLLLALAGSADSADLAMAVAALRSDHTRLRAAAISCIFSQTDASFREQALDALRELTRRPQQATRFAAVEVLARQPVAEFIHYLRTLLTNDDARIVVKALHALARQPLLAADLKPRLEALCTPSSSIQVRLAVMACSERLPAAARTDLIIHGLQDHHLRVRRAAVSVLVSGDEDRVGMLATLLQQAALNAGAQQTLARTLVDVGSPTRVLESLAVHQACSARDFMHALTVVGAAAHHGATPDTRDYWELVTLVLRERALQAADRALILLEPVEGRERIGTVRAALQSDDPRFQAAASEVVRHFSNRKLASLLLDIVDNRPIRQRDKSTGFHPVQALHTLHDVLTWCRTRPDPWLARCAQQVAEVVT